MSVSATPSRALQPVLFPQARLRIISSSGAEEKPCHVVLAISQRIYWKVFDDNADAAPKSLRDFKNQSSLELERLNTTASWSDVNESILLEDKYGPSVVVQGLLHGRERWATFSGNVKIILSAKDAEQRDKWVHELHFRIAPWQLLYVKARKAMPNASQGTPADELARLMDAACVALGARFSSMFPGGSHAGEELPRIFDDVRVLLGDVTKKCDLDSAVCDE